MVIAVARSLSTQPMKLYEKKIRAVQSVVTTFHMTIFRALGLYLDSTIPESRIPMAEKIMPTTPAYKLREGERENHSVIIR